MITPELRAAADAVVPDLERAREVSQKAADENRAMTAAERNVYDTAISKVQPVLDRLKDARKARQVGENWPTIESLLALGGPVGSPSSAGVKDNKKRLSFKGSMAAVAADRMLRGVDGEKALAVSGSAVVAQQFVEDPVALGRVANSLLDVLPVEVHPTAQYARLVQTTRTNAAAIVEEGDEKPESVIGLTRVEKELKVLAHLSEPIQRYWLLDNQSLERFVATELQFGLGRAVEAMIISDISSASGVQTRAFSDSALTTIRKSVTQIESQGYSPAAIVLHPEDWEGIELALSSTNAVEHLSLPFDPASRRLFGIPVAVTVSADAGTGHVIAEGAVVVDTDSFGVTVQWSENVGDSFKFNDVIARCEGRYGTSVLAPLGCVVIDLTEGS